MPSPKNFINRQTPTIDADWLNQVDTYVATFPNPPTSGTYGTGDFVKNANMVPLGQAGAQYLITGWYCIQGGTPGTWVAVNLPIAPLVGVGTPAPPAPAPTPLFAYRIQGEAMTGVTTVLNNIPGYDGTGFTDVQPSLGPTYTATFPTAPTGTYNINIRYFTYGTQHNNVQIDAGAINPYVYTVQNPLGWATLTIPNVALTSGVHAIKLISDWGFVYFDYVELVQLAAAAPPAPAPGPAPAPAPGSPPFVPFGSRIDGAYPNGITVTGQTNAAMDAVVKTAYANWKNNRLSAVAPFTPTAGIFVGQTISNGYVDKFRPANPGEPSYLAVSEGIGYGMLIAVIMAGFDANAKAIFDGMFYMARAFPAYSMTTPSNPSVNNYLMDWRIDATPASQGGGYNAADGDLDIALALFMAHRQWGSATSTTTTQINYYQEALNIVNALKQANFAASPSTAAGVMYVPGRDISRTSDFMPFNFHVFRVATNDTFWDSALTNSYNLLNTVITNYSGTAHLPPDWIYTPFTNPQPSPGNLIEGSNEGNYASNAIRDPWRWNHSYLFYADSGYHTLCDNLITWFRTQPPTSGNPSTTTWAYTLAGAALAGQNLYFEPTTCAGLLVGAMGNALHQTFLNTLWTTHSNNLYSTYYACELQLLALMIASGNWWKPF